MTASLQATALLATDPLFQGRVQAAMVTAAVNVAAEAVGSMDIATYTLRHNLAAAMPASKSTMRRPRQSADPRATTLANRVSCKSRAIVRPA